MGSKFINVHSHIFTVNHAPDYFLQTVIKNRNMAILVQRLLQKKGTRGLMKFIKIFFVRHRRGLLEKYINFLEIGLSSTQEEVFKKISSSYKKYGDFGIVVLPQVLDTLDLEDTTSTHKNVRTQVEELVILKRDAEYQKQIFPFLPVDPRSAITIDVKKWLEFYINSDKGFCGIKIYPAAGFFPWDVRLDPLWAWAEKNEVPIMTHCTRTGSFYLGSQQSIINSSGFFVESLNPQSPSMEIIATNTNYILSIDSIRKKNGIWCNVFGDPECYKPVLEKYQNLKICFAHLGGTAEVLRSIDDKPLEEYPAGVATTNWYNEVLKLMQAYPNVYGDISYTLNNDSAMEIISRQFSTPGFNDEFDKPMIQKLLYGTDFYMTQQEKEGTEPMLQDNFEQHFSSYIKHMAYFNPYSFLQNLFYKVI